MVIESFSIDDTVAFAAELGQNARSGDIFCLSGELGVGKTVFVKGFAKGLGVLDVITSPTFTLVNEYVGNISLFHFDLYRITAASAVDQLLFEEYLFGDGVCVIEWAENIRNIIPPNAVWIDIKKNLSIGLDYRLLLLRC